MDTFRVTRFFKYKSYPVPQLLTAKVTGNRIEIAGAKGHPVYLGTVEAFNTMVQRGYFISPNLVDSLRKLLGSLNLPKNP